MICYEYSTQGAADADCMAICRQWIEDLAADGFPAERLQHDPPRVVGIRGGVLVPTDLTKCCSVVEKGVDDGFRWYIGVQDLPCYSVASPERTSEYDEAWHPDPDMI
jgi:hypothetical protein